MKIRLRSTYITTGGLFGPQFLLAAVFLFQGSPCRSAPDYKQIAGDWDSNYGPVHVEFKKSERPTGSALLTGSWLEAPGHKGEIKSAHYNASTGELLVEFEETWSKNPGNAKLILDKSGKKISGKFKANDGSTGTWTWTRK